MKKVITVLLIVMLLFSLMLCLISCSKKHITITFVSDGDEEISPIEYVFDGKTINQHFSLPSANKENKTVNGILYTYTFEGWSYRYNSGNDAKELVIKSIDVATFSQDVTVYAKFEEQVVFGEYPQTLVDRVDFNGEENKKAELINSLNNRAGGLPTEDNDNGWCDYNFYKGGEVRSYIWYKDVEYLGEKYRGVFATDIRQDLATETTKSMMAIFDKTYNLNQIYWFKWEPIIWDIISNSNGETLWLVSDKVLDAQAFNNKRTTNEYEHNGGSGYANNYELSDIRQWINNDFLNTAFNQGLGYLTKDGENLDYVNLMSSYSCTNIQNRPKLIKAKASDYALALNLNKYEDNYANWWLCTPTKDAGSNPVLSADNYWVQYAQYISYSGVEYNDYVDRTSNGVRPRILLKTN